MSLQMCRWIDHSDAERVLEKVAASSRVRRGSDIDASDQQTENSTERETFTLLDEP